ncbi:MAG: pacearchaeosortase [archaeon]
MKYYWDLVIRYGLAIIIGIFFNVFYWLFTPWTVNLVYWILKGVYNVTLQGTTIMHTSRASFTLIPACVAASAYLFLSILILITRDIDIKDRMKMLVYGWLMILVFNILRIFVLILVYLNYGKNYFDALHLTFWYVLSTIAVVGIWIFLIHVFKVRGVPVYSDIRYVIEKLKKEHQ